MDKYKYILEKIPSILVSNADLDKCFNSALEVLIKVVDFDCAYVCYLNSDNANIRYKKIIKGCSLFEQTHSFLHFGAKAKKLLYSPETIVFDSKNIIAKDFKIVSDQHFLLTKLLISGTVFGFIILGRETPFNSDDCGISKAFSSLASYSIKDSELSNVFELQLKALQESIIDKAQAHATIKKQNEKILEADKVKSEFLANTSHELRTPLNAIIGFSEVLSKQLFGPLNEKQSEYIKDIHVSGLHLLGMINEILEISKIESKALKLTPSKFNLKISITEVVNVVQALADKKKIHLIKEIEEKDSDLTIFADYQKIQQIMYNLLSNAIKFTPAGGHVQIGFKVLKSCVEIYVKDDGIGIDEQFHDKVFNKFVQLHNVYCKNESSTGLGLAITKELAELHGGSVSLKSTPNKGSCFYIKLPLASK